MWHRGFYVHNNFNFVISERKDGAAQSQPIEDFGFEAGAIDGAPDE